MVCVRLLAAHFGKSAGARPRWGAVAIICSVVAFTIVHNIVVCPAINIIECCWVHLQFGANIHLDICVCFSALSFSMFCGSIILLLNANY